MDALWIGITVLLSALTLGFLAACEPPREK